LIAGALLAGVVLGTVNAAGDIRRLAVDGGQYAATMKVEADVGVDVTDFADGFAGDLGGVDIRLGGHLAGQNNLPGRDQRFDGHAAARVLRQQGVQNRVANLVGD